LMWESPLP